MMTMLLLSECLGHTPVQQQQPLHWLRPWPQQSPVPGWDLSSLQPVGGHLHCRAHAQSAAMPGTAPPASMHPLTIGKSMQHLYLCKPEHTNQNVGACAACCVAAHFLLAYHETACSAPGHCPQACKSNSACRFCELHRNSAQPPPLL